MSRFPAGVRFQSTQAHSSNFTNSTWDKNFIVLHWWDNPARRPSFDGVVSWFRNPSANVSCQYVVEHNRIAQMTPESAYAWHAGSTQGNRHGIGIEVNPRLSDGDYETTAVLVAEIWRRRGRKLPLRRHREFTSTNCPGTLDVARVQRRAEQLYSGSSSTPATPATGGNTMSWSTRLKSHITGNNIQAGNMLRDAQRKAHQARQAARQAVSRLDTLRDRVWTRNRKSLVSGKTTSMSAILAWSQYHSTQANHKIDALASTLDELLDGQGKLLKAVKDVEANVKIEGAEEVAKRLKITVEDVEEED